MLVLLPALARPVLGIALVGVVLAAWLAWKSVAYPLALAGAPTVMEAILGYNPLPKGGVTFIFAAWVALAVAFAMMRGGYALPLRALMSLPVTLSFVLLGLMMLRLDSSAAATYGSTKIQLYVADNLVFLIGAIFVGTRQSDRRLFLMLLLAVTSAGALLLLFELLSGNARAAVGERFSLGANEYPIYLARNSANGLIVAIFVILAATKASVRLWAVAVLPVLLVAMIAAGSRGPVVSFVLGLATLIALSSASARTRRRLLLVMAGLLVAAAIVPLVVPGSAIGRSLSTLIGSSSGLSSNGRSQLWSEAYTTFGQHPLVGIGTGGFAAIDVVERYPHNILLEFAVELGVAGLIVIAAIIVSGLRRLLALWRSSIGTVKLEATVLLALFLTALVNAFFSGAVQDNSQVWVWTGVGLGMAAQAGLSGRRSFMGQR